MHNIYVLVYQCLLTIPDNDKRSYQLKLNNAIISLGIVFLVVSCLTSCGDNDESVTAPPIKAWGTPVIINDNTGGGISPQIAFDASGNAHAVWVFLTAGYNIMANHYTAGIGWGTAELIDTDKVAGHYDHYPQIAVDTRGNALAVWSQSQLGRTSVWANRYTAGIGWGTAELIENAIPSWYPYPQPQIAIDGSGNALAVWKQTTNEAYVNRYTAGIGWGTAELIKSNTNGTGHPHIAMNTRGNALAVWTQSDGTLLNMWANRYTAGFGWDVAELIETDSAGYAYYPQIAIDANGNALAVWNHSDGTRDNIMTNRYTAGIGWGTSELIETDNAGTANYPQIAIDANGDALAVWFQGDGRRNNIWANRYTAGIGWSTAELIESDNMGDAWNPQIAIDANGDALAVWFQSDGTRDNIWANRYLAGSGWGTAELIETNNTNDARDPQIAIDSSGNAIVVWWQSGAIWANRFE